jgi:hypothetical protein
MFFFLLFIAGSLIFKVGCLHPIACTRSGSGFPSNATLVFFFQIFPLFILEMPANFTP